MVLCTWSRLVQKLLKEVLDQSVGRMPIVALELLVCLFLQLFINCARFGQNDICKTQKGPPSCAYEKESQPYAQYPMETKSEQLQKEYQVVRIHANDCQDRSYGSSRLTGINWSRGSTNSTESGRWTRYDPYCRHPNPVGTEQSRDYECHQSVGACTPRRITKLSRIV